jgi:hypothetical protein
MKVAFVTGMQHSATRLAFDVLNSTGAFSVPFEERLNSVKEYDSLHKLITDAINRVPLSEDATDSMGADVKMFVSSLTAKIGERKALLIKMPYYPMVFRRAFGDSLKGLDVTWISCVRDFEEIFRSCCDRNEDIRYMGRRHFVGQIKKLPLQKRAEALNAQRFEELLRLQYEAYTDGVKAAVGGGECVAEFVVADIEASVDRIGHKIGEKLEFDRAIIDQKRLSTGKRKLLGNLRWKLDRLVASRLKLDY